jgi:hypothetical protein
VSVAAKVRQFIAPPPLHTQAADAGHSKSQRHARVVAPFGLGLLSAFVIVVFTGGVAMAVTPINLGSAAPYAVLAGTTITNTGSTVITGDVGLSPGTSITGFPPALASGSVESADAGSLAAENDSTAAYGVAAGETPFTPVAGGTIGTTTLSAGVYQASSSLAVNGVLTLDGGGDANAIFIFQAGSTLTTASSASVILEGGAQACNVFWQVGSSATLGSTTNFVGTILAQTSITLNHAATVVGSVQAQTGAVTLDDNTITVPTCLVTPPPTTTTTTATPTTTTTTTATATPPTSTTPTSTPPTSTPPTTATGSSGATTAPTRVGAPATTKRPIKKTKKSGTTTTGPPTKRIPVGAPDTGEGGTAGAGFPMGLVALAAFVLAASAGSITLRTKGRRD